LVARGELGTGASYRHHLVRTLWPTIYQIKLKKLLIIASNCNYNDRCCLRYEKLTLLV
jgi:hypothetical protein